MKKVLALVLLFVPTWTLAQQRFEAGSDWVYGPGKSWVYEPGRGLSFDLGAGLSSTTLNNPDGTQAISEGYMGKFGFYFPYSVQPYFDIGLRLSTRFSFVENNANNSLLKESSDYFGIGPGIELRFYRFVFGAEYYFDKANFETAGRFTNNPSVSFQSYQYYAGLDIPIRPFQLRILWQRGKGDLEAGKTGLSQDSGFEETSWYIGIRYSTDFTWSKFKESLL